MGKSFNIAQQRLLNQSLLASPFTKPREIVRWMGALQAQDYTAAKYSLGLRLKGWSDADIEVAFSKGEILRTHVMRPTWHFVAPENIRWMLALTRSRVRALLASYDRKLELDERLISHAKDILGKALEGRKYLTREEISQHLEVKGISAHGQRLAHLVMHLELDAIICSGPRRGKQFTYALLEERVPQFQEISRDEALARLVLIYFTSHGPAQIKDFTWWSGLTMKDAIRGIEMVKSKLIKEKVEDKTYYFYYSIQRKIRNPRAFLLSIYDEYTIAYRDRSALGGGKYMEKLLSMGNALTSVVILDGRIIGTWKRLLKKDSIEVKLNLFRTLDDGEEKAVNKAVENYGKFLNKKVIF